MVYVTLALAVIVVAMLWAHVRERKELLERIGSIVDFTAQERAKLLDRIQHPQVYQVQPGPVVEYGPLPDERELAQVGTIVYGESDNGSEE